MNYNIVTLPGDGIGPDIVSEAVKVLNKIGEVYGHTFNISSHAIGGDAIDKFNTSLPQETIDACLNSDSVLLGAVGGPKWENLGNGDRPEKGLLAIRNALKLYANLRPAVLFPQLKFASPLKEEVIGDSLDILIVRELTGGIYFGEKKKIVNEENPQMTYATDEERYYAYEIERILRVGFESAQKRNNKVCIVDKANVLESSRLWREVAKEVAKDYEGVEVSYLYIDNAAMQLIGNPKQFDVIITSNIFGDILSDEASKITGSIGMLASASLGSSKLGLYEPIHGSAPDIASMDIANPLATILSVAMMFRYSFGLEKEAQAIENAISEVLDNNYRTKDIYSNGMISVGTKQMGDLVVKAIK